MFINKRSTISTLDVQETCGQYYDRKDEGTGICEKNGYDEHKPDDYVCVGEGDEPCTAAQCCYNDGDYETCGEYYDRKDEGTGICEKNGYEHHKPEDTLCPGGVEADQPCTAAICCYNGGEPPEDENTCEKYFEDNDDDVCDDDGFEDKRNGDVQCGADGCTSVICCKKMRKCKAYFLTYTKEICNEHNQNGAKDSDVE
eukprot:Pgem_evm1s275